MKAAAAGGVLEAGGFGGQAVQDLEAVTALNADLQRVLAETQARVGQASVTAEGEVDVASAEVFLARRGAHERFDDVLRLLGDGAEGESGDADDEGEAAALSDDELHEVARYSLDELRVPQALSVWGFGAKDNKPQCDEMGTQRKKQTALAIKFPFGLLNADLLRDECSEAFVSQAAANPNLVLDLGASSGKSADENLEERDPPNCVTPIEKEEAALKTPLRVRECTNDFLKKASEDATLLVKNKKSEREPAFCVTPDEQEALRVSFRMSKQEVTEGRLGGWKPRTQWLVDSVLAPGQDLVRGAQQYHCAAQNAQKKAHTKKVLKIFADWYLRSLRAVVESIHPQLAGADIATGSKKKMPVDGGLTGLTSWVGVLSGAPAYAAHKTCPSSVAADAPLGTSDITTYLNAGGVEEVTPVTTLADGSAAEIAETKAKHVELQQLVKQLYGYERTHASEAGVDARTRQDALKQAVEESARHAAKAFVDANVVHCFQQFPQLVSDAELAEREKAEEEERKKMEARATLKLKRALPGSVSA